MHRRAPAMSDARLEGDSNPIHLTGSVDPRDSLYSRYAPAPVPIRTTIMPERQLRPLQSPARGLVTCEHDPALWQTAALRYRAHLTRGGGVFYVGIPPHPDSPEAANWTWRSRSEILVRPPFTFRTRVLAKNGVDSGVISDEIVTEQLRCWTTHSDKRVFGSNRRTIPGTRGAR